MYEKCNATLQMEQIFLQEGFFDENEYPCQVILCDREAERIYLISTEAKLPLFSLDASYLCHIETEEGSVFCRGVIVERYENKLGSVLVFIIKNGFYKNV